MDSLPNCACWTSFFQCYPISSTLYMCMPLLFFKTKIPNEDDPFLGFFFFFTFSIFLVHISYYPYIVLEVPHPSSSCMVSPATFFIMFLTNLPKVVKAVYLIYWPKFDVEEDFTKHILLIKSHYYS